MEPTPIGEKTAGMTLLSQLDDLRRALEETYTAFDALFAFVTRLKNEKLSQGKPTTSQSQRN